MTLSDQVEVLLVEDSEEDAMLTIRSLRKYNLANSLHRVEDGEEALEYLFGKGRYAHRDTINSNPKLVLLDLKIPKLDGLQVLRAMKADENTRHIPVVVLTSSAEDRDVKESYKLGVNSYIVKPVEFEKFAKAVRDLGFYWLVMNKSAAAG